MKLFEVRDHRVKEKFFVDDAYLNGYAKELGAYATCVYLSLCRHADKKQESFPSIELISGEHSIGKRTVSRAVGVLLEWNIISVEQQKNPKGKFLHNSYTLLDKKVWKPIRAPLGLTDSRAPIDTQPCASDDISRAPIGHYKDTHREGDTYKDMDNKNYPAKQALQGNEINEIISLFEEVNPLINKYFGHISQRAAAARMLKQFGREKLEKMIRALPVVNAKSYWPKSTTPLQLENNIPIYKAKNDEEKIKGRNKNEQKFSFSKQ